MTEADVAVWTEAIPSRHVEPEPDKPLRRAA
jgi:hypothetical protein